jgi:hypothetical protein
MVSGWLFVGDGEPAMLLWRACARDGIAGRFGNQRSQVGLIML